MPGGAGGTLRGAAVAVWRRGGVVGGGQVNVVRRAGTYGRQYLATGNVEFAGRETREVTAMYLTVHQLLRTDPPNAFFFV